MNIKLLVIAAIAFTAVVAASLLLTPDGAEVFRRQGCIGCHGVKGEGGVAVPGLAVSSKTRSYLYLRTQIKDPKSHSPDSRMPAYGHLSEAEVFALIRYIRRGDD